ncbi:MAG TPA: 1-acyl-sn-glycerol-3-phosphate acyltransferase [Micropruina sp.]|nr:glycerol acyltransferase [Propionibacterium sp.]HMQ39083.1 1-acyl-sn-glycerol-3-phosphate acyltransferase [Micropruina sp.]HMR22827.1 1-acyl-sn-glycerol-3-phosphate acyltransferase [Micropruina sp.]
MSPDRARVEALAEATIDDLARGFHLPERSRTTRALLRPAALRFAVRIAAFDDLVATRGMAAAARAEIPTFARSLTTVGRERVPATGPVLAVANHPGVIDALSLMLALESRADLKVVALDRAFLRALPGVSERLIWVEPGRPFGALRLAREHLLAGGALLTFPAGTIEPDPAVTDGAIASLYRWSRSCDLLVRHVAGLRVVPLAVGGVLSARALRTPFVRRAPTRADREWTAATLQVILRRYHDTDVRVLVGEPFTPGAEPTAELVGRMRVLLEDLSGPA